MKVSISIGQTGQGHARAIRKGQLASRCKDQPHWFSQGSSCLGTVTTFCSVAKRIQAHPRPCGAARGKGYDVNSTFWERWTMGTWGWRDVEGIPSEIGRSWMVIGQTFELRSLKFTRAIYRSCRVHGFAYAYVPLFITVASNSSQSFMVEMESALQHASTIFAVPNYWYYDWLWLTMNF